jgi:hypothetical protein
VVRPWWEGASGWGWTPRWSEPASVAFQVEAAGSWTIAVKPLTEARRWDAHSRLAGHGDDVIFVTGEVGPFATATLRHDGKGNFAVWVYSPDEVDLVVNEIGRYRGQVVLLESALLLEITASADWSIALD